VEPQLVGVVEFTGFSAGGRLRLPHWQGLADPADVDLRDVEGVRWARPPEAVRDVSTELPAPVRDPLAATRPGLPDFDAPPDEPAPEEASGEPPAPPAVPVTPAGPVETGRRLEQHFVYNSLNTIASLIRTDPVRARELLFGFADLSRAADQPDDAAIPLGNELDAVRGYLQLEQARFGKRLRVELEVDDALHSFPITPMTVLGPVRAAVQHDIEPLPEGGVVRVYGVLREDGDGEVGVIATGGTPSVFTLSKAAHA
jgi:bifunctional non-homologous end joining protein LigD